MSPDPVFVAMLKTPECREIWEKVLEMRGVDVSLDLYSRTGRLPHLGELWAIAKEKANPDCIELSHDPRATGSRAMVCVEATEVATHDIDEVALVSYIVGKPWVDGKWKETQ